jgi:hypothetical protein
VAVTSGLSGLLLVLGAAVARWRRRQTERLFSRMAADRLIDGLSVTHESRSAA